ncbi:MAG: hypothetical protein Q9188_003097 [Gyalolechia gomerana]
MAEITTSDGVSSLTWEEKFSALEVKFASLEEKYYSLHEKAFTITEHATGKSTGSLVIELPPPSATTDGENASHTPRSNINGQVTNVQPPEANEIGTRSRAKVFINKVDKETGERQDNLPQDSTPSAFPATTDTTYAFTLRKYVYDDREPEENSGEIEINDQGLWDLLKGLLGHYPYHIFQGQPVTITSPYEPLVLYWDILGEAAGKTTNDEKDKQARSDLRLLLDTIRSSSGDPKLDKYLKNRDSSKEQKSVTFETLWTIFPPGSLIYGQPFLGQDQIFIVQDCSRPWPYRRRGSPNEQVPWILLCWVYDWDGKMFKRMGVRLEFEHFDGNKPITSLPYYPFELNERFAVIKEKLIEQGKKYRRCCTAEKGSRMFDYVGEAIFAKRGFSGVQGDDEKVSRLVFSLVGTITRHMIQDDDGVSRSGLDPDMEVLRRHLRTLRSEHANPSAKPTSIDSRAMVDFESYFRYCPSPARVGSLVLDEEDSECLCDVCSKNEALNMRYRTRFDDKAHQEGVWEDEQYMLCPPRVLGYILRDKQWAQLQVSSLRDIPEEDPKNAWVDRLKLADGDETKNMILNLVRGHGSSGSSRLEVDDIIARKGKGLVMLLYGPPGVGKTSTAETVAIAARKPLFAISVADVGTEARKVEANLSKIFALATSWQAILLIDEADVFLEKRGHGMSANTERNALVSGILMLTTNQIAQFDVAVQSRIHIAVKYGALNKDQSMAIFDGFLAPLARAGLVKDMESITKWLNNDVVKMELDGRQIRNVVTSALGVARAQGKDKLEKRDMKQVLNNVKGFKEEFIKQFEKYKTEQGMPS